MQSRRLVIAATDTSNLVALEEVEQKTVLFSEHGHEPPQKNFLNSRGAQQQQHTKKRCMRAVALGRALNL